VERDFACVSASSRASFWRILWAASSASFCIELDDRDKALLKSKVSVELKIRHIVLPARSRISSPIGPDYQAFLDEKKQGVW
jgi:hypothetical protein